MFAQHPLMEVLVKLFQKNRSTFVSALRKRSAVWGQRPCPPTAVGEIPFFANDLYYPSYAFLRFEAAPFRQTPVFHTFFLPKRERKYQRKRFRAAARTPRGHRSCSALSSLEMRHRLQRCYCIPQNEALAPLMWRKTYVFGCSRNIPPKTPEGTWALFEVCPVEISKV